MQTVAEQTSKKEAVELEGERREKREMRRVKGAKRVK